MHERIIAEAGFAEPDVVRCERSARLFSVPPKKRRKRAKVKSTRAPKRAQAFVGDRILAAYTTLSCCCLTAFTSLISAGGFGIAFAKPYRDSLKGTELAKFAQPGYGLAIGIIAAILTFVSIALVLGLWNSRKWSLWTMLAVHLPGAVVSATSLNSRYPATVFQAVPAILVAIYCLLRVTGVVGPKV